MYLSFLISVYSIDATEESQYLGRLINHSLKTNVMPKIVEINEVPRLIFIATQQIDIGEELLYNYNDNRPDVLKANPWLKDTPSKRPNRFFIFIIYLRF